MPNQPANQPFDKFADLRQRAEAALANAELPGIDTSSFDDVRRLLSELQIHQIELEMQNEELRRTQLQLATERSKYADLYNFAPVAYFTVDYNDVMVELNLAAAELLAHEPRFLIDRPITPYLTSESLATYIRHRQAALDTRMPQTCELTIRRRTGTVAIVQVRTIALQDDPNEIQLWRTVMTDITESKKIEEALRESEGKFRSIAEQTSDLIALTDVNGLVTYASLASFNLFLCGPEEMIGHPFMEFLDASSVPVAMAAFRDALELGKKTKDLALTMRRKDGSTFIGELNGVDFHWNSQSGTMVIIRDITERKRLEQITQLRLKLFEYAASHSLTELMQKALDEIEIITTSSVSFYHFVQADQKTLTLQAWSTRTQQKFCQAEGKNLHYNIDQAGVWTDCVKERKPIIHNDYASLPHRKGMPEGHAQVVRELVVPTMREGHVVSILGVGNKASDYNEHDVELVEYLADVVWEIVERNQAEEKIRQQLQELRLWHKVTLEREMRVMELKSEVNDLLRRLNEPLRYESVEQP